MRPISGNVNTNPAAAGPSDPTSPRQRRHGIPTSRNRRQQQANAQQRDAATQSDRLRSMFAQAGQTINSRSRGASLAIRANLPGPGRENAQSQLADHREAVSIRRAADRANRAERNEARNQSQPRTDQNQRTSMRARLMRLDHAASERLHGLALRLDARRNDEVGAAARAELQTLREVRNQAPLEVPTTTEEYERNQLPADAHLRAHRQTVDRSNNPADDQFNAMRDAAAHNAVYNNPSSQGLQFEVDPNADLEAPENRPLLVQQSLKVLLDKPELFGAPEDVTFEQLKADPSVIENLGDKLDSNAQLLLLEESFKFDEAELHGILANLGIDPQKLKKSGD